MALAEPAPFEGFPKRVLDFLRDLREHNDRDWFLTRKSFYKETVQEALRAFIVTTSQALQAAGLPLRADEKKSVFRIYRDTRFSADKRPFKTNLGAIFGRTAGKESAGILYFHLEPGSSFMALAFYQPDPATLTKLREAIVDRSEEFLGLAKRLEQTKLTIFSEDSLKRVPRGFEEFADQPITPFLKMRSLLVRQKLSDRTVASRELVPDLVKFARSGMPLLEFGWDAIHR